MKKVYTVFLVLLGIGSGASLAVAQDKEPGTVSASYETNTILYFKDKDNPEVILPPDHFGSNNYLKLDYNKGRFSAGVQFEAYAPVLQGYPSQYRKADLMLRYAQWQDKSFGVTVGDFYEQFGSGMIFRAWEDRALGFNNAIEGARITYTYNGIVNMRGFWGRPRYYMDRLDTQVRGLDVSFVISNLVDMPNQLLSIEGSFVSKYEDNGYYKEILDSGNTDAFSARVNYEYSGFSLKGEYVDKGKDLFTPAYIAGNDFAARGNAILAEAGYSGNGLGVLATFRRLEYMANPATRDALFADNNMLNYLPNLTQQNTYLLTNIDNFVYPGASRSEIGGQVDVYYNFRRGTALGGKRGWKLHLNFSNFSTLNKDLENETNLYKNELLYRGVGVDMEKWWSSKFKTTILYSFQNRNYTDGENQSSTPGELKESVFNKAHIFVLDMTYRINTKTSLRAEAQYLYSDDATKDWIAALVELNFAPRWSVFVSEMYNLGNDDSEEKRHYYSGGFSFSQSRTRLALSVGRNRKGYVCSGGVCRVQPAYTGAKLEFSIAF